MDEIDEEFEPWDAEAASISSDKAMSPLDQLQRYQHMARKVFPYLDPYETSVLIQILDRITGWRKTEARFSADALFVGDKMYGGLARTMDRSRMMKALRSLQARGLIRRRAQPNSRIRIYWVNTSPDILSLERTAPSLRKSAKTASARRQAIVSNRDDVVQQAHHIVSANDIGRSEGDTGEGYQENDILHRNLENFTHPEPGAPDARPPERIAEREDYALPAALRPRPDIKPPARRRTSN